MRQALGFSLLFHAALALVLAFSEITRIQNVADSSQPAATHVRSLTEKEFAKMSKLSPQIVASDDQIKNENAELAFPINQKIFLSKNNQTVDANTRAARVGSFKNILKEGLKNPGAQQGKASENRSSTKTLETQKLFQLARNPKDLEQEKSLENKTGRLRAPASEGEGFSQTDDYLEDVAVGAHTLLNTREFVFYGFFERLRVKLSNSWNSRLESEIERLLNVTGALSLDRRTQVEVTLDEIGRMKKIKILRSSGLEELDRAATQAFVDAAPFPNPPRGMLEDNKSVQIRWDFVVVADSERAIKVNVRRLPY
jgi:TonB family protein